MSLLRRAKERIDRVRAGSPTLDCKKETLGSEYGSHTVCLENLSSDAVVYSAGIGEDISFDLAMIERVGATVHGFDPTPRSLEWLKTQDLPEKFHVHGYGFANFDGTAMFNPPKNPNHISHTILDRPETSEGAFEVQLRRVATIAAELGHSAIDVLKMDIEGAEYDVLDDLEKGDLVVNQLLIEFHHQFESIPFSRTQAAVKQIEAMGLQLFHISDCAREYSFLRA